MRNVSVAKRKQALLKKIRTLPAAKVVVVEDFVDFIRQRDDSQLAHAFSKLSEGAFKKVWENPDDAVYDRL
ncbi:MAG: toxin-antitoxin system, antitoxin component, Xre family protein [Nitrospirae bacterium]|nr:toxin-antitoxin system, antitoxin component, Xre family protein [Nitrospirota bacterium]